MIRLNNKECSNMSELRDARFKEYTEDTEEWRYYSSKDEVLAYLDETGYHGSIIYGDCDGVGIFGKVVSTCVWKGPGEYRVCYTCSWQEPKDGNPPVSYRTFNLEFKEFEMANDISISEPDRDINVRLVRGEPFHYKTDLHPKEWVKWIENIFNNPELNPPSRNFWARWYDPASSKISPRVDMLAARRAIFKGHGFYRYSYIQVCDAGDSRFRREGKFTIEFSKKRFDYEK